MKQHVCAQPRLIFWRYSKAKLLSEKTVNLWAEKSPITKATEIDYGRIGKIGHLRSKIFFQSPKSSFWLLFIIFLSVGFPPQSEFYSQRFCFIWAHASGFYSFAGRGEGKIEIIKTCFRITSRSTKKCWRNRNALNKNTLDDTRHATVSSLLTQENQHFKHHLPWDS